ncbi:MAG: DUF4340 domain-containing protein [Cephaloticoccus sp.]|nr:DUF4340 domain-containing protein [Cephaloticoccus sp.]
MRTKVTLILVFLNVALFFFIFKFERGWRTEQASLEARRRVLGAETADIRSLKIYGPNVTTISLARQGDNWSLLEPIEWPANPHAVSRIINELQYLEHETSFSVADLKKNNQSLADYGLERPRLIITFTSGRHAGGGEQDPDEPTTLKIGDETKVGNRLYVLSPDGSRVHVVNLSLARSLALPIEDLRADTVFSIPVFEARSLNLQNAANLRVRVRREGNRWAFEAPIIARASKPAVELTINALNALRVRNFISNGTADINPATNSTLRITIEGNNRRETLILGSEIGNTAIPEPTATTTGATSTRPDMEFNAVLDGKSTLFTVSLPAALVDALRNAQEILRETKVLDFDPAAVTAITLAAPNRPDLTLQLLEAGATGANPVSSPWQIVRLDPQQGPQTQPADTKVVQILLEKLRLLVAQKFVSDAPSDADLENWGFNRPEREITLTLGSGANTTTLTLQIGVAVERDGKAYARLGNARFVYLVDAGIISQTSPAPLDYRQRLLRELPAAAKFSKLTITDLRTEATFLDSSLGPDISDQEPIQTVLTQLRTLRASRFVQNSFPESVIVAGEARPWRYRLNATITLPGGSGEQTEVITLFFTERLGGNIQLAGSPDLAAVFEIEQPLVDAMWQLTYGAKDPGPPGPVESTPVAPPRPTLDLMLRGNNQRGRNFRGHRP